MFSNFKKMVDWRIWKVGCFITAIFYLIKQIIFFKKLELGVNSN